MFLIQLFETYKLRLWLSWLDYGKVVYCKHVCGLPLFGGMSLSRDVAVLPDAGDEIIISANR